MNRVSEIERYGFPPFIYGTAWKEDATEALVRTAMDEGFRGIDTANQRRHYVESAVGDAIRDVIRQGSRSDLFIQTKFTYVEAQDHRLPYDPATSAVDQVRQSFQSSLSHLGTDYIDAYLLHGPSARHGLTDRDREVWQTMEEIHREGGTRYLGVSNVSLDQLEDFYQSASIKPVVVQNRCFAQLAWDRPIREFCLDHHMIYEGFSLLTANAFIFSHPGMKEIAARLGATPAQIVFRFAIQAGMLPLTGTTNPDHMKEDLGYMDFVLSEDEVRWIEEIAVRRG